MPIEITVTARVARWMPRDIGVPFSEMLTEIPYRERSTGIFVIKHENGTFSFRGEPIQLGVTYERIP